MTPLLTLLTACLHEYPETTYLAHIEVEQATESAAAQNEAKVLNERLGALLAKKDLTITFFPPSSCLSNQDVSTAGGGALLSTECGLLMSALEERAALNGYDVVSWQYLRGNGQRGDSAVDVIFEVDYLAVTTVQEGESQVSGVELEQRVKGKGSAPLVVDDIATVGQRCVDNYGSRMEANYQPSVSLSIKAVGAKDGRSLWYMRYTGGGGGSEASRVSQTVTFYPRRDPTQASGAYQTARSAGMWMSIGGAVLAGGGAYGAVLRPLLGDGSPAPFILMAMAGTGLLVPGLIIRPSRENLPYQLAQDVVCDPTYAEKQAAYPSGQPAEQKTDSGSSWGQSSSRAPSSAAPDSAQVLLTQQAADAVFEELAKIRAQ